jgi:hypothetical protein
MTTQRLLFARAASSLTFDAAARIDASGKRGRPRRWVVERANSWHNNFRALPIRWETKACALIAYRAATRRNGHQF